MSTNNITYYLALLGRGKSPIEAWKLTKENMSVDKSLSEFRRQVDSLHELKSQGHGRESFELQVGTTIASNKSSEVEEKFRTHMENLGEKKG